MGKPGRADRTVTVERTIAASPQAIFDVLADPKRHGDVDGSGMVLGNARGPDRLADGTGFSQSMKLGPLPYRSVSRVTEFVDGSLIAWQTAAHWRGHTVIGGQIWRYRLLPVDGGTRVVHSYDWGAALAAPVIRLAGYPRRMAKGMPLSLDRLADALIAHPPISD